MNKKEAGGLAALILAGVLTYAATRSEGVLDFTGYLSNDNHNTEDNPRPQIPSEYL